MLIRVDLPAPFSPTMPVMAPLSMASDTPRTACTLPNDLSIATSSIAGTPATSGTGRLAGVFAHVVVNDDLARDDVGLGLLDLGFHLRRDQLLVVLVERPIAAAFLQAQHLQPTLPGPSLRRLEALVSREIDALGHRRQHGAGMQVVLVGIDADRVLAAILGGLQYARAGVAGGGIDHVDAAVELALGKLGAAARIVPGGRRGAGHVGDQLGIGIGVLDALLAAALEAADQRDVHATDEADLAALGSQRRQPP